MNGFGDIWNEEIFYSAVSRYRREFQGGSNKDLIASLFGSNTQVAPIDLPNHLQAFVSRLSPIHSLTLDHIIDFHTLYPYHSAFLDTKAALGLRAQMASSSERYSLGRYGHNRGKASTRSPLRYCAECVRVDRASFGEAYFHRVHQIDIVHVCPQHSLVLEDAIKCGGNQHRAPREFISLEELDPFEEGRGFEELASGAHYLNLAKKADWLIKATLPKRCPEHFRAHYHKALIELELMTFRYQKQHGAVAQMVSDFFDRELLDELGAMISPSSRNNWISAVMNMSGNYGSPIYHLLLAEFLSIDLESLFETEAPGYFGKGPWPCLNPLCSNYGNECIKAVAVSASGRPYRISGTFRCRCGFSYLRYGPDFEGVNKHSYDRVIDYGRVWQKHLRNKWTDSKCTRRALASELGVSQASVYRYAHKLGLLTNNNHRTEMAS
ncbi:MAG: hypothetical protein EPO32_08680 [Anaerolineae bacterium]|nr:MAG: hypothetical protein EPO32_08680 [Anaerolineae bacterium]